MMSQSPDEQVTRLLNQFITLRKTGKNRDDAWYAVMDEAGELEPDIRKRFLQMAKEWEKREGHQYRHHSKDDSTATLAAKHLGEIVQEQIRKKRTTQDTVVLPRPRIEEAPQPEEKTAAIPSIEDTQALINDTASYFAKDAQVALYFRDFPEVILVEVPPGQEVVIGRKTPNAAMAPDVDLTPVKAEVMGVSRMHAVLRRRHNAVYISDLGSRNFTYLNGKRLHSHEVRVLKDGDEVSFGHLAARVHFQKRES
jgi:hypothetical protein